MGARGWAQGVGSHGSRAVAREHARLRDRVRAGAGVRVRARVRDREQRSTVSSEHVRLLAAVGVVLVPGASEHDQEHAWVRVRLGATVRATAAC